MQAEYITHSGDDLLIVNAARVSFSKESEFDWIETDEGPRAELSAGDTKLINYLARHNHWTPFSHPQITVRETVPIFVARQRFKHMVGFTYNEVSRRYVDDTPEFFIPDAWRSRPEGSMKQGSGSNEILHMDDRYHGETGDQVNSVYEDLLLHARVTYDAMLAAGIAPEQARMVLPQSMYTSYYVTGSLAAWARAYKQRIDAHAQVEIQDLAKQWNDVLAPLFPVSWKVLTES